MPADSYALVTNGEGFRPEVIGIRVADKDLSGITVTLHLGTGDGMCVQALDAPILPGVSYSESSDKFNLIGIIFDNSTGLPLPGVKLSASSSVQSQATVSDDKGRFRYADLDPGKYTLSVSGGGYFAQPAHLYITRQTQTTVNFVMVPASTCR